MASDPLTAALNMLTEAFKLRGQWFAALSEAKRTEWADKHADAELDALANWLAFVQSLRPKP
jgi:hypothetical protein